MTQWLADENFKDEILDGVWLRLPGAQIVKAKEIGLVSADDPTIARRCRHTAADSPHP